MSKSQNQGQGQPNSKQKVKQSSDDRPTKRTHSEVSNDSLIDMTAVHNQLDEMTQQLGKLREDILKKDDIEKLITTAVKDIMKLMEKKITETCKEIRDELEALRFDKQKLEDDLKTTKDTVNKDVKDLNERLREAESRTQEALRMANYNEQYSRKNNFKIMDIPEEGNESEEKLTEKVCNILRSQNAEVDKQEIMAIHRIPTSKGAIRPILVKLKNNNIKSRVMRKRKELKQAGHKLVDDVTKLNAGLINRLYQHEAIESAWYFNGAVFAQTHRKERIKFDLYDNITEVVQDTRRRFNRQ